MHICLDDNTEISESNQPEEGDSNMNQEHGNEQDRVNEPQTSHLDTSARINAIQEAPNEDPASKDHTTVNAIRDILNDENIDDDKVVAHANYKAVMATYQLMPLPMVHHKDIVFGGPKGDRHFTTEPGSLLVSRDSNVYRWGGAAVKLQYDNGVRLDAMVCSVDKCKGNGCYPDATITQMPTHTPRPYAGKPFVHVKRDCEEVDGDLFFRGNAFDLPYSRWSELPVQVEEKIVWFEVDDLLRKTVAQGCVVERCYQCSKLP